ncbi:MAG: sulfate adenylyltransferase subunit 1, partial [Ilumatobacteraceae bacterium]
MGHPGLLRVVACGSVDDGKSTLIGRLLHDTEQIPLDHLAAVIEDSRTVASRAGELDLALVTDGLAAEREQGITIDVAYRYFSTTSRRVILADAPGHEQYTRNMATGASTADVAIVLVDARTGVLTQTRRHTHIVHLLGVRTVVLCVNKMDLVDFDERRFRDVVADYVAFADRLGGMTVLPIPTSALLGDNIATSSSRMPWFDGAPLVTVLDQLEPARPTVTGARLPVQLVIRPDDGFRGYAGRLSAGRLAVGDDVRIMPAGTTTTIARLLTMDAEGADQDLDQVETGQSIVVTFSSPVDCSRGDMICSEERPSGVADQFRVTLIWMSEVPMLAGRPYHMKIGTRTVGVTCSSPRHRIDVDTGDHIATTVLELNDIGVCNIATDRPIAFDPYRECAATGGFILVDRYTSATIAAGMIEHPLRRSENIHPHATTVGPAERSLLKG